MKLHYFHGRGPLRELVMVRDGHRIELHIRPVGNGLWGLVALAGPDQGRPDGQFCRGPWKTQARAESVLRSVAGTMMGKGYEPRPGDYAVWSVTAQRLARRIGTAGGEQAGRPDADSDQFDPLA
ncbi:MULTISPECIES: hypothetical protein [Marinobacter]|uniref:WGR domain-containing protein n=1 Tax=Marinobacter metalliresistant TaxID=2961995 RepID=A0ABZ2VX41_9GAMM|nr:hypothetical protein [Marinobacter sp. Arc7-DN-1]AXS83550.1 hypothetical protein D0851_11155 [Marinobacter sp. Arc7-DN-1]